MRSFAKVAYVLGITCSWAQQLAFHPSSPNEPFAIEEPGRSQAIVKTSPDVTLTRTESFSDTIVSTLSASTQHTTFLKLLQRSKCIPLLAHINTSTVFAPTDQAWAEWADKHRPEKDEVTAFGWLDSEGLEPWLVTREMDDVDDDAFDNQNWALRQHLLYHMLNYTLPAEAFVAGNGSNITTETTLLFPMVDEPEHTPLPPPGPPWLPRGGEGLLSGHGQRVRLAKGGSDAGHERGMIGVDWSGRDGVSVWDGSGWNDDGNGTSVYKKHKDGGNKRKDDGDEPEVPGIRWVRNGVVVGIEGVLEPPPSIGQWLAQQIHCAS